MSGAFEVASRSVDRIPPSYRAPSRVFALSLADKGHLCRGRRQAVISGPLQTDRLVQQKGRARRPGPDLVVRPTYRIRRNLNKDPSSSDGGGPGKWGWMRAMRVRGPNCAHVDMKDLQADGVSPDRGTVSSWISFVNCRISSEFEISLVFTTSHW